MLGMNFDPTEGGDPKRRVTVALSGYTGHIWSNDTTDTRIRFLVPDSAAPGKQAVSVTSTAGSQTPPHPLEIRSADMVITAVQGGVALRPGRSVTLLGRHLGSDGQPLSVLVGSLPVEHQVTPGRDSVTFVVPDPLPSATTADTVTVTLKSGQVSVPQDMQVDRPRVRSAWRTSDGAVSVAATGWHSGAPATDPAPLVLVDGRPAAVRAGFRENPAAPLIADPPSGSDPAAEARIAVHRRPGAALGGPPARGAAVALTSAC